jgi:hypothetical protein
VVSRAIFKCRYQILSPYRLGVKTRIFHLGDYRRATMGPGQDVPDDYFFVNASATSVMLRQKILKKCREDIYDWLNHENGQVAIYDAVNPLSGGRRSLAKEFARHDVQVRSHEKSRQPGWTLTILFRRCSLSHMSPMTGFYRRMLEASKFRHLMWESPYSYSHLCPANMYLVCWYGS